MRIGGFRCAFCASVLLAVIGGAGATWSKVSSAHAYVSLADDMGRPGKPVAAEVAPPAAKAPRVVLPPIEAEFYRVEMAIPDDCHAGSDCELKLRVLPQGEWRANRDAPFKFVPKKDAASRESISLTSGHVDRPYDGSATVHVLVRAKAPGVQKIEGVLKVFVCNGDVCRNMGHDLSLTLPVR